MTLLLNYSIHTILLIIALSLSLSSYSIQYTVVAHRDEKLALRLPADILNQPLTDVITNKLQSIFYPASKDKKNGNNRRYNALQQSMNEVECGICRSLVQHAIPHIQTAESMSTI